MPPTMPPMTGLPPTASESVKMAAGDWRASPGWTECRPLILTADWEITEADVAEIRASWAARHASQPPGVPGGSGELAERITTEREWLAPRFRVAHQLGHYPADGPCVDCGMRDEPIDGDHRCRFCAELAELRAPCGIWMETESIGGPRQAWPGSPRLTACAVVLLAAVCASVVLGVPAAAVALLALAAGGVFMLALTA